MGNIKRFIIDNKKYFILGIVLVIIIVFISIISNTFSTSGGVKGYYAENMLITNDEIENVIINGGIKVIYVVDSSDGNIYNEKINSYLEEKNITYSVYDISKVEETEYKELLGLLNIDFELFGTPAIIYIQDGMMFANIIHLNDLDVINRFISDYDLEQIE